MRIVLAIITTLLVSACALEAPGASEALGPHVSVQGESRVEIMPNMLTVHVAVTHTAKEVAAATESVQLRAAAALEAARAAGIADADRRALSITVQPMYDYRERERVLLGHQATRTIELKVRDLEAWPALMNALVKAGVDRFDSVAAGHSDRDALARNALADAVKDARARADLLAEAAGTRVTGVYSINESGGGWAPPPPMVRMAMATEMDKAQEAFDPGTITITANIQATFRLRGR